MVQSEVLRFLGSPEQRVRVSRNVTIRGERPRTMWDPAFLKRRIAIDSGVEVTLESLFIPHSRQPSATSSGSLDIFAMDFTAVLGLRNVTLVYPLCIPTAIAVPYASRVQRPPGYPGTQAAISAGPVCFSDVDFSPSCFNESVLLKDFVIPGSTLDSFGTRFIMGVVMEYDTLYTCQEAVLKSCLASGNGTAVCTQQAIEMYGLQHGELYDLHTASPSVPPSPPSPPALLAARNGPPVLAIALPCALGGLALLSVVAGVAYWRERRRRMRSAGVAVGPKNSYTKASGTTHGSATERCESGPGPIPDSQRILLEMEPPAAAAAAAAMNGGGGNGAFANGSADGLSTPKWVNRGENGGSGRPAGAGAGGPPKVVSGLGRSTTMSSAQSGSVVLSNGCGLGGGGGGPYAAESLLGNPLLVPLAMKGSGCNSGPGITLNMVLGVDVFASREAVVGRGSFATVLEGHMAGRPVAVKLFHRDALGGTADDVKSLKQEIAILARCQHPNVVALLGAGSTTAGDEVFLVEELMVCNLARACHEGEGLPLQQVLAVARDVAAGLAYLHPTVIHRDLKPANVLLDPYGTAKLTDFGLSRLWASTVHTANPEAGTVQYMAPECFSGSLSHDAPGKTPISHLSDIYGFGVLLWEMLTRERPWRGLSSIQVALAVGFQQQRLKIPETDNERFHPKLRKLLLQCWDEDPRKRPGAAEITKRLSLLLQHIETHGSLNAPAGAHGAHGSSIAGSICSEVGGGGGSAALGPPLSGGFVSSGSLGQGPGGSPRVAAAAVAAAAAAVTAAALPDRG